MVGLGLWVGLPVTLGLSLGGFVTVLLLLADLPQFRQTETVPELLATPPAAAARRRPPLREWGRSLLLSLFLLQGELEEEQKTEREGRDG